MESLFGKTFQILTTMLDYRAQRQKVITSNVSNLDTPDFKPKDLKFPDELKNLQNANLAGLTKTDPRHLPKGKAEKGALQYEVTETGDRVSIDTEMMNVAENNLNYNLTIELLARKFRSIQNVLKETR